MVRVDTNYILRYLMNDDEEMASIAEETLIDREVFISNEILAEVVYVLNGVYKLPQDKISSVLIELMSFSNVVNPDKHIVLKALEIYGEGKLDFVDCILCAYSKVDEVLTFDKKLQKCLTQILH